MDTQKRTQEEKNINRVILLGSTIVIAIVSFILIFVLTKIQTQELKKYLKIFKNTIIQKEKLTIKSSIDNLNNDILYKQKEEEQKIKQVIKNQTEIAKNLVIYLLKENRGLKKSILLEKITKAVQSISIPDKDIDYFIFDKSGTILLNTKYKQFEGKNFLYFKDLNDQEFVRNIITKSKRKNPYVEFLWYKPYSNKIKRKITYAKYIKELNIIIGSGRYIDNDKLIKNYLINKIEKQKFDDDNFILVYKIKSLNNLKKHSFELLRKNIKDTKEILDAIGTILLNSRYEGSIFYTINNKLVYTLYLPKQKILILQGVDLRRINSIIKKETEKSNIFLQKKIFLMIVGVLFVALIFFILSYIVGKKIENIFKNYRKKLLSNEKKYQLLFNHSNDGFIISKIDKNSNSKIINANSIAKQITGFNKKLIGKDFFLLFKDFDKYFLLEKNRIYGKFILLTRHKNKKSIELSCVIYKYNEETLLFASLRDITERINLQKEKEKQESLLIQKSKMAAMGEMIGNIAHQWRQPISQLSGLFFDIEMAYDYNELDKKYLSKRVEEANDLLEYMSKTIDDFKEFYKPNMPKEKFSLYDNINKTIAIINPSLKYHYIKIKTKIDKKIYINSYSNELSQVLLNIISNSKEIAIERNIKNPVITISTNIIDNNLVISIEDNCGGIENKIFDKIFEPYFTTKYNYGTGIGLYMSKMIIENKINGKIVAHNSKNGAIFSIYINGKEVERVV